MCNSRNVFHSGDGTWEEIQVRLYSEWLREIKRNLQEHRFGGPTAEHRRLSIYLYV